MEVNSHLPSSVQPVCPPIKALFGGTRSNKMSTLSRDELHENLDYFGTTSALGNFQLPPLDSKQQSYEYLHSSLGAVRHEGNTSSIFEDSDVAFTSFSGVIINKQVTRDALK